MILGIVISVSSYAGDPEPGSVDVPDKSTPLNPPVVPDRPNAPSRVRIMCDYGDGYVRLTFPEGIWSATVSISNGSDEWFGFASVDEPLMETPSFSGEYTIRCFADNGSTFVGTLVY